MIYFKTDDICSKGSILRKCEGEIPAFKALCIGGAAEILDSQYRAIRVL